MASKSRGRGVEKYHSSKGTPKIRGSDKDRHRESAHGRAQQAMGSGGKSGGTKSSGGRVRGGSHGADRGKRQGPGASKR